MPAVGVILCCCGDLDATERIVRPLREFGPPQAYTLQRLPFPVMQRLLDDAFPEGTYNYWKSTFVSALSDGAIELIVEHANRARSPLTSVVVEFYGGAASRVGAADTAFAQRHAHYDVGLMAQWTDPAESAAHIAWAREAFAALRPHSSGGYLLNFLDEEAPDTIKAAFGHNHARLVELKNKYDPRNFFQLNQNVQPTA